jgi:hypothetical protein
MGELATPKIENPICRETSGSGLDEPPLIRNPDSGGLGKRRCGIRNIAGNGEPGGLQIRSFMRMTTLTLIVNHFHLDECPIFSSDEFD